MDILIIGIISYLMGSIPFGLLLTKIFLKKDIRDIGSGNIGATNVLRTGNKTVGYITLSLDILKAVIPVIFVKIYYTDYLYLASLCAFIGHVFREISNLLTKKMGCSPTSDFPRRATYPARERRVLRTITWGTL